jgi:hypothetical protein
MIDLHVQPQHREQCQAAYRLEGKPVSQKVAINFAHLCSCSALLDERKKNKTIKQTLDFTFLG